MKSHADIGHRRDRLFDRFLLEGTRGAHHDVRAATSFKQALG